MSSLPTNQGKGAAISHGIFQLNAGELFLVVDADGSANLEDLPAMMWRWIRQTAESNAVRRILSQTEFDSCGEQGVIQWQDREGSKLIECPGGTVGVSMTMLLEVLQMRRGFGLYLNENGCEIKRRPASWVSATGEKGHNSVAHHSIS